MENLVFRPKWAHICTAKKLRIEFLALTYTFIEISNHTTLPQEVTCFDMSKVICHPSWINLYLHLELSWIWVEIFFAFVNFICERNHLVSHHFFLKYFVYTLVYHENLVLNCKYSRKVWKYLSQSELHIYFVIFFIRWFLNLKLWKFSLFSHLWFGLRIFSEFSGISQPGICTLKLWIFFTRVLLELDFENFLKFFQTQLTWKDFENFWKFSNLYWLWLNFEFLNLCTHMTGHVVQQLSLNDTIMCHLLTQLYCTWLMFPLQRFRHSIKICSKHFII